MVELMLLLVVGAFAVLVAVLMGLRSSNQAIDQLRNRIDSLEKELNRLQHRSGAASAEEPKPANAKAEAPTSEANESGQAAPPPLPAAARTVPPPPVKRPVATTPAIPLSAAKPEKAFDLLAFLRSMGLWPPRRREGSSELVLMQWWAPRIGGGLAILAIIFFAVYVAQGTPPWVKFAEMLAASFGVFGLGLFFSRKRPGLGNVLVATGLSMVYISSVAGYAVGPVKVVDNPILGALMQGAALVLSFGMGAWRKDRGILVLAIVFGYGSSLFAALEGFREAALISSLLIYVAGLFSYRKIGGLTLSSLALAGVYLPLPGFLGIEWIKDAPVYPGFWTTLVFLVLTVSVLPACQRWMREPGFLPAKWNRLYQSLNTTIALGLGYLFVRHFYPLELTEFYGCMAALFLLWSIVWYVRDYQGLEFHLFFLKGSALASLWFIHYLGGDWRWIALGIQVILLAASAHRTRSVFIEGIAFLTWIASFIYFAPTVGRIDSFGTFLWFIQGAYILVSVSGLAWLMGAGGPRFRVLRNILYVFPALVMAVASIAYAEQSDIPGLEPVARRALMAAVLFGFCLVPRFHRLVPLLCGGVVFLAAHLQAWFDPVGQTGLLVLLAVSALALAGLLRTGIRGRDIVETGLHVLWVVTLSRYFDTYSLLPVYPLVMAVFSLLLLLGGYTPLRRLGEVCALPLLLMMIENPFSQDYPAWGLWLFLGLTGLLANAALIRPGLRETLYFLKRFQLLWWTLQAIFLYWTHWALDGMLGLTDQLLLWSVLGVLNYVFWYGRSQGYSLAASLVCAAIPVIRIVDLWLNPVQGGLLAGAPWAGQVLLAGMAATLVWLGFGGYNAWKKHGQLSIESANLLAWACGLVAYLVYAATLAYPLLNWDRLYTPLLGVFSIGLIILGILIKSRPYRFVAMLTFIVPLFRLFVYDIRETLYRIIAFAVLAIVLTVVGFLYQKFSERIQ